MAFFGPNGPKNTRKISKYKKYKSQFLFVSQMSSKVEKMRQNEATGEDFYILEENFRSLN